MFDRFVDYLAQRPELLAVVAGAAALLIAVALACAMDRFIAVIEPEKETDADAARATHMPASDRGADSNLARWSGVDGVPIVRARESRRADDRAARLRATVVAARRN